MECVQQVKDAEPTVKLVKEQHTTRANVGPVARSRKRSSVTDDDCENKTEWRHSGGNDMKKVTPRWTSDEPELKTQLPCEKFKQKFTDFLQGFISSPVCESLIKPASASTCKSGVSAERECFVRHAELSGTWGFYKGRLKFLVDGSTITRWQFDSTKQNFPLVYMFAVNVGSRRRYIVGDTDKQRLSLTSNGSDPSSIDVDTDTSDERLFVYEVPVAVGANAGFLHPFSTWNNSSQTLLSVSVDDKKLVLSEHNSWVDMWTLEDA